MNMPLRHSHIAILDSVANLAAHVGAPVLIGEDDLGTFSYFDIQGTDGTYYRFASHDGDRYVHLLADVKQRPELLGRVLTYFGINQANKLSISTDHDNQPLLDLEDIFGHFDSKVSEKTGLTHKKRAPYVIKRVTRTGRYISRARQLRTPKKKFGK